MSKLKIINIIFLLFIFVGIIFLLNNPQTQTSSNAASPKITPSPALLSIPTKKILINDYFISQSFNNCGPASLSMALSYFKINKTQEELGLTLRPYQNEFGDNDDKSVTLDEMAAKAREYNLITYHRPNGSIDLLKKFITHDIPVITRTWLNLDEDIGHYRIVKGFDDSTKTIFQDDSYQGQNLEYSYDDFNTLWEKFNYEYLVLVPKSKQAIVEKILDDDLNPKTSWLKAVNNARNKLIVDPQDYYTRFNLSVALYNSGQYKESVNEFEKIEYQIPWRTLWYQIEPVEAYYQLGNYDRVFSITDSILNNENRAFTELYVLRGKIYQKQQNFELAKTEFENGVYYNSNLKSAKDALKSLPE